MNWESRYLPSNPHLWQGRIDVPPDSSFFQHVQLLNFMTQQPQKLTPPTFGLLGFKCDEGAQRDLARAGAAEGPQAIRAQLSKLPVQIPHLNLYDMGDIFCNDHDMELSQAALGEVIAKLLQLAICPIVIGGSHELSWGHYQGIAKTLTPKKKLGILNFDPHFDLHPLDPQHRSSATTSFYEIATAEKKAKRHFDYNCIGIQHPGNVRHAFEVAKAFNTHYLLADELHAGSPEKCTDFIDRLIDENDFIYVSLSLDVFAPAFAPGVSTIQPLGLNPWHVIPLLRQVASSGKVISYDIAEHAPRYDIDHRTAKLAAMLIYEIIHHHR